MHHFFRRKRFRLRCLPVIAVLVLFIFSGATAQKVRLRAQIKPECTGNENSRFADIYADGNIAVQGSFSCRGVFIYDLTNPDAPTLASWYNPGNNLQFLEKDKDTRKDHIHLT